MQAAAAFRSVVSSGYLVQIHVRACIAAPPAKVYARQEARENGKRNIFAAPAGTEELGHLEMVGTIVYQLTRSMTPEQIKQSGYDTYFVDHTAGVFPQFASGTPWTAATIGVTGDVIADLSEDMSAEQKARKTYDNILRLCDDPDVTDVIRFLREREVVHYQRFGEALRLATEKMDQKNVYMTNPAFDRT
jgi:spore coat protein JC